MKRFIPALVASVIALLIGYLLGRSNELPQQQQTSLYVADVSIVDAETGLPLNASLCTPDGFRGTILLSESGGRQLPGTSAGPLYTEQDAKTGRCRIIWLGTTGTEYRWRFSADGYADKELPQRLVTEIAHTVHDGGVAGPSLLPMDRNPESNQGIEGLSD